MKIKILELHKHRNETTFRPYLQLQQKFAEYNVFFTENDDDADVYFVGQASIIDKKKSLNESVEGGINFLQRLDKPYILFDGQDSSSLMGIWDVFKEIKGLKLVKNVILKDVNQYSIPYPNGRWYWGKSDDGYFIPKEEIVDLKDILVESGTNWLNTYGNGFSWQNLNPNKTYDVCVLIGMSEENYEYGIKVDQYYNEPRQKLFNEINKLSYKCITTEQTGKLDKQKYFEILADSRFCISPFGYGEVNIREIECLFAGTDIIKPDIGAVTTTPNIYGDKLSYTCKNDFSDIHEIINNNLESNFLCKRQRDSFNRQANPESIVQHLIHNIFY